VTAGALTCDAAARAINPETIFLAIRDFLQGVTPSPFAGAIDHDTSLLNSGLDSMAMLQLVLHLGETLGVEIADEDFNVDNFETVGALVRCVAAKRPA
jgi:acyl carrier protein